MDDIDRFLREDLGRRGDITTRAVLGRRTERVRARIWTRERAVAAGLKEAKEVFRRLGCQAVPRAREGAWTNRSQGLLDVRGSLSGILAGERLALNFIGRMSGIATQTRILADRVHKMNSRCAVAATRKTTPGFRAYEKRAVMLGGGDPHRAGLHDAILIKDNHLAAVGGIEEALRRVRRRGRGLAVEIEVTQTDEARQAAAWGAQWILIDNQSPAKARRIAQVARTASSKIRVEVSGRLNLKNVLAYAAFADRLSLGALTHSARSIDVTLDLVQTRVPKH